MLRKLFLNPVAVFLGIWLLQVACYRLDIARFMPQDNEAYLALAKLFGTAAVSFLGAYALAGWASTHLRIFSLPLRAGGDVAPPGVNVVNLRCVMFGILAMVAVLDYTNYLSYGPMPLMTSLELTPADQSYIGYGRLNYVLYGAMFAVVLLTSFEPWWFLRQLIRLIYVGQCVLGLGRANLIVGLLQGFVLAVLLDLRTVPGARRGRVGGGRAGQSMVLGAILVGLVIMGIMAGIGQLRTGNDIFKMAMQIRPQYMEVPSGVLWIVGYISFPLANIISLELHHFNDYTFGQASLFPLAPPFLWGVLGVGEYPERYISLCATYFPNPLNNVATYQSNAYFDAGYAGMVMFNVVLGLVASFMVRAYRRGLSRTGQLLYVIFLSRFFLIFFADTFFNILTIVEVTALAAAARWIWVPAPAAGPEEERVGAPVTAAVADAAHE